MSGWVQDIFGRKLELVPRSLSGDGMTLYSAHRSRLSFPLKVTFSDGAQQGVQVTLYLLAAMHIDQGYEYVVDTAQLPYELRQRISQQLQRN